jgi:hypothetical protein
MVAAATLAGCAGAGAPVASPTATKTSTPTPTKTPTPTPTPTPTQAAPPIPTDCSALGTEASRQAATGDLTLQGDGTGFVRPVPDGAILALGCDWVLDEVAGVLVLISTASPDAVTAAVGGLPGQGYTCTVADDYGATFCQLQGDNSDSEEIIVARGDTWIYLSTVNRNGRAFLTDIATQIWS